MVVPRKAPILALNYQKQSVCLMIAGFAFAVALVLPAYLVAGAMYWCDHIIIRSPTQTRSTRWAPDAARRGTRS